MLKHIQNIKPEIFLRYFRDKKICLNSPFLLAIDCDRTLVDRKRGSHFVSDEVISMFNDLRNDKRFIVAINTGRDLTSYRPIQVKLSHLQPCLFLSGRVLYHSSQLVTLPSAVIPQSFCSVVWEKFKNEGIPFLDIKHERGNTFFVLENRDMKKYYGLYKPIDWFNSVCQNENVLTKECKEDCFHNLKVVRFEIPFFKTDYREIVDAIQENNREEVSQMAMNFFGLKNCDLLQFIPVNVDSLRKKYLKEVAYIRVVVNAELVNKGTGVKALMNYLSIPEPNVICFGDSAGDTASDAVIKQVLPHSTLFITEDGDTRAAKCADFLIKSVSKNGVPEAVSLLTQLFGK
jgi:hydroxymethylpyrimidine pyrophosphatase-like HAD family hydrolase